MPGPEQRREALAPPQQTPGPLVFAIHHALLALFRAWGIAPAIMLGHGMAELAAACAAGVMSPADALRLTTARGDLESAVGAGADAVRDSHEREPWRSAMRRCASVLDDIDFAPARVPLVESLSGQIDKGEMAQPGYWMRQFLSPVDAGAGLDALRAHALDLTIALPGDHTNGGDEDEGTLLRGLGGLYEAGASISFRAVTSSDTVVHDPLPCYPFPDSRAHARDGAAPEDPRSEIAYAGDVVFVRTTDAPASTIRFVGEVRPGSSGIDEHRLHGLVVVAAAWQIARLIECVRQIRSGRIALEDVSFHAPLIVTEPVDLRIEIDVGADRSRVRLLGRRRAASAGDWTGYMTATLCALAPREWAEISSAKGMALPLRLPDAADIEQARRLYAALDARGYHLGPSYRRLRAARRSGRAATGVIEGGSRNDAALDAGLIDSWFHVLASAVAGCERSLHVPVAIRRFAIDDDITRFDSIVGEATLDDTREPVDTGVRGDLTLKSTDGTVVGIVDQLETRPLPVFPSCEVQWRESEDLGPVRHAAHARTITVGSKERSVPGLAAAPCLDVDAATFEATLLALVSTASSAAPLLIVLTTAHGDSRDVDEASRFEACRQLFAVLSTLSKAAATDGVEIALLTQGAVRALDSDDHLAPSATMAVAMLRSAVTHDLPGLRWHALDLDASGADDARIAELLRSRVEGVVAWRGRRRLRPCLVARGLPVDTATIRPGSRCVITGGAGAIGHHLAEWLIERGGHVTVTGRATAPGPWNGGALEARADRLTYVAAAVEDERAMARLWDTPVDYVFHLAGTSGRITFGVSTWDDFKAALTGKVDGARALDRLVAGADRPARQIYFSSIAGTLGAPGQSAYAAANAYLDALACRGGDSSRTMSIGWTAWRDTGMAAGLSGVYQRGLDRAGVGSLDVPEALELLGRVLTDTSPHVLIGRFHPFQLDAYSSRAGFVGAQTLRSAVGAPGPANSDGNVARVLRDAAEPVRSALVLSELRLRLAEILEIPPLLDMSEDTRLAELGVDSLTALELRTWAKQELGVSLSALTLLADATLADVARAIADGLVVNSAVANSAIASGVDADILEIEI